MVSSLPEDGVSQLLVEHLVESLRSSRLGDEGFTMTREKHVPKSEKPSRPHNCTQNDTIRIGIQDV